MVASELISETSLQYLSDGISLHEAGKISESIQMLRKALEEDPRNYLASYLLGICYRDIGNRAAARRFFQQAFEIEPAHKESMQALGLLCIEEGNVEEGIKLLKDYLRSVPGDVITLRALGMAYARQRNYSQALRYLEQAYQSMPDDDVLKLEFGLALFRSGQPERAKDVMEELIDEHPSARVLTELAILERDVYQNYDAALRKLERAVRLDAEYVRAQRQIGVTYLISGNPGKGLDAFKIAAEREPENTLNWRWIAQANMAMGRWEEARNALQTATKYDPNDPVLWFELAQVAHKTKDLSMAQEYIRKAVSLAPDQAEVFWLSLVIDLEAGQVDQVYQAIDKALKETSPEEIPAWVDRVISLAIRAYSQNNIDVAKRLLELVAEKTSNPRALNNLGYVLTGAGKYEDAEEKLKLALEHNFENPELTYANLGYLNILIGNATVAENYLRKAGELAQVSQAGDRPILRVAGITSEQQPELLYEGQISLKEAILGNLAVALAMQNKFDDALVAAKNATKEGSGPTGFLVLASIYSLTGNKEGEKSAMQKARELFSEGEDE